MDPHVEVIETPTLGDRSYLVHDGTAAFVVDPQRDVDRVLSVLDREGVRLTDVFETHIHNDYLTGGLVLARETGAAYHVNAADRVGFDREPVADGDTVPVGDLRVTALATPGHTFTHLSYALAADGGEAAAVFTGGSLLFGSTGRPDLMGAEHTGELARLQHASARRLAAELGDDVRVLPTHGFGSFCSSTQSDATESTIGRERRTNPVLRQDADVWVAELLAALDVWPRYYVNMAPGNAAGPGPVSLEPPQHAGPAELRRRLDAGEWVVDLRTRRAFAAGHAPRTLNFGLDGSFATYLGWLIPWGTPLTLLAESPDQLAEAQRELVRIGIDRPAAAATGGPEAWSDEPLAGFATASFTDLAGARADRPLVVLDVRRTSEYDDAHLAGSVNVPLHELPDRVHEVPDGETWVHCKSGYRASIAGSLLAAAGRLPVVVDDDFDNAAGAGLPVTSGVS
jgi:glyoxylase-like metal-dependent hydrolase (beta-lactamase superfamily II)/rhodanese-related sulfurtransferase